LLLVTSDVLLNKKIDVIHFEGTLKEIIINFDSYDLIESAMSLRIFLHEQLEVGTEALKGVVCDKTNGHKEAWFEPPSFSTLFGQLY
jgi:hypothetical protein